MNPLTHCLSWAQMQHLSWKNAGYVRLPSKQKADENYQRISIWQLKTFGRYAEKVSAFFKGIFIHVNYLLRLR